MDRIILSEFRFRKLKDYRMRGPYKFQGILHEVIIDNSLILEGIDVDYYYTVLRVKYFQNLWKLDGKSMWLFRSFEDQEI